MNPLIILTLVGSALAAPHVLVPGSLGTLGLGHAFAHPSFYTGAAVAGVAAVNPRVNLNIPAPIPNGAVGPQNVQTFGVKALGRPVVSYTPQITEVRPELNIVEKVYNVPVPKPVYQTKHITPIVTKHVSEPYDVPAPYAVPHQVAPVAAVGYAHHGVAPIASVGYAHQAVA